MLAFGWLILRRIHWFVSIDRNLGMLVGIGKSALLVAIGLWTVLAMEPRMIKMRSAMGSNDGASSALYHRFLNVGQATRQSRSLSYLAAWNPIAQNPQLSALLDQSESMIRELQNQNDPDHAGGLAATKLTSLLNDLQQQWSPGPNQ